MNRLGIIGWMLSAVLAIVIIFMRSCDKPTVVTKVIPGDKVFVPAKPIYHDSIVYQPTKGKTVYQHDTVYYHDTVTYTHTDTVKAASACLDPYVVKDTSKAQDVIIYRYDSLYMNRFVKHEIMIKNTRQIQVIAPEKFKIFAGASIGLSTTLKSAIISPSVVLETKTDALYSLSYDLLSKTPQIGFYWKIHLK